VLDYLVQWLELLLRWSHIIAAIAWIGASFYFNFLENQLDRWASNNRPGMAGHLWAIHGGGFYYLEKYQVAPPSLPEHLHWFKWEAYATWLSGFSLLAVVYYGSANVYLIDPRIADISTPVAIGVSMGTLVMAWLVYDGLCRSPVGRHTWVLSAGIAALLVLLSWGLCQIYNGRGAFIHVGAAIGTIMVANVFFVIIPNQRDLVAAVQEGRDPDPAKGKAGLARSRHNNYLTLPVAFAMFSNHYPATYSQEWNWLLLVLVMAASALVRDYFNSRASRQPRLWVLPLAAILLVGAMALTVPGSPLPRDDEAAADAPAAPATGRADKTAGAVSEMASDERVWGIVSKRCLTCHAENIATGGVAFRDISDVARIDAKVHQVVVESKRMPPGNATGITADERATIRRWYEQRNR